MEYIIVDTNSFIYAIKNKIDLLSEILYLEGNLKPVLLSCVKKELLGLSSSSWQASAALKYSERFMEIDSSGHGDDCILKMAEKFHAAVLTNDRGLIKRLKNNNLRVAIIFDKRSVRFF